MSGVRARIAARRSGLAGGLLAGVVALSGCGSFAQEYPPTGVDQLTIPTPSPHPRDFVDGIDNRWSPFPRGARWVYRVTRPTRTDLVREVSVRPGPVPVAGVATTAVERTLVADAKVVQRVVDLYAQDRSGNVWWFGHHGPDGSWRAGEDGAEAGLLMAAGPRFGDGYRRGPHEVASVEAVEKDRVVLQVTDPDRPGTALRETYEPGVGLVSRLDATGELDDLVSSTTRR